MLRILEVFCEMRHSILRCNASDIGISLIEILADENQLLVAILSSSL